MRYGDRGVSDKMDYGCVPFSCFSFRVLVLFVLALCHAVEAYRDTEPLFMLLETLAFPARTSQNVCREEGLFPLPQVGSNVKNFPELVVLCKMTPLLLIYASIDYPLDI